MRYPRKRPESNHLLTVRGATLQIFATWPVVNTFFMSRTPLAIVWCETSEVRSPLRFDPCRRGDPPARRRRPSPSGEAEPRGAAVAKTLRPRTRPPSTPRGVRGRERPHEVADGRRDQGPPPAHEARGTPASSRGAVRSRATKEVFRRLLAVADLTVKTIFRTARPATLRWVRYRSPMRGNSCGAIGLRRVGRVGGLAEGGGMSAGEISVDFARAGGDSVQRFAVGGGAGRAGLVRSERTSSFVLRTAGSFLALRSSRP